MNRTIDSTIASVVHHVLFPREVLCMAWPYGLIGLFMVPGVYWILMDHSVWPWDQAWYGEVSVDLWFTLVHQPAQWFNAMLKAFASKAPGVAWFGQFFVPIGSLSGSIEFGLLLSIAVVQFGTLILTFKIGQVLSPNREVPPLLTCMMVASAPLFIAMTHQYFAEPLQLFGVTYIYWIAAVSPSSVRCKIVGHLLLATGIALLSKATSPVYCFVPGGLALYHVLIRRDQSITYYSLPLVRQHGRLLFVGIAAMGSAVAWYARNFAAVKDFVKLASSSEVALDYGRVGTFFNKLQYWMSALQKSMILPEVLLVLVSIMVLAVSLSFVGPFHERWIVRFDWLTILAFGALLQALAVLALFSLNINEENRYLLPLLPSIAIIFLWLMSLVRMRIIFLAVAVAFIGQWIFVEAQALGLKGSSARISYWVLPSKKDHNAIGEVQDIVKIVCNPQSMNRYNIVGIELPWFNANSLSFYAAKERLRTHVRCYYTSLGYAEKSVERALERIRAMNIAYFISLDEVAQPRPPNFLNQVSLPVLQKIEEDPHFIQESYKSALHIVIFRNRNLP